jgi:hypothetical protein
MTWTDAVVIVVIAGIVVAVLAYDLWIKGRNQ